MFTKEAIAEINKAGRAVNFDHFSVETVDDSYMAHQLYALDGVIQIEHLGRETSFIAVERVQRILIVRKWS